MQELKKPTSFFEDNKRRISTPFKKRKGKEKTDSDNKLHFAFKDDGRKDSLNCIIHGRENEITKNKPFFEDGETMKYTGQILDIVTNRNFKKDSDNSISDDFGKLFDFLDEMNCKTTEKREVQTKKFKHFTDWLAKSEK